MSELTEDELSAIKTIDDAATKAGLTGDPNDKGTPRGSLFALIGADTTTTITSLALISVDDFAATVRGWRISEVPVAGQPPVERPPTLMENGQALYVARIARLKLGHRRQATSDRDCPSCTTFTISFCHNQEDQDESNLVTTG